LFALEPEDDRLGVTDEFFENVLLACAQGGKVPAEHAACDELNRRLSRKLLWSTASPKSLVFPIGAALLLLLLLTSPLHPDVDRLVNLGAVGIAFFAYGFATEDDRWDQILRDNPGPTATLTRAILCFLLVVYGLRQVPKQLYYRGRLRQNGSLVDLLSFRQYMDRWLEVHRQRLMPQ
jgi:hypothetical protein